MSTSVVLLLTGSLRAGSSNNAVLATARAVAPDGVEAVVYEGLASLPHFNPDDDRDPLPGPVAELRGAIERADAVLICTPEYAGTLPGSFKNLLDWTVGGAEINDKPTAWANAANPGRGLGAEATLRSVLEYTGAAIVEEACVRVGAGNAARDEAGLITDAAVHEQLRSSLAALVKGTGVLQAIRPHQATNRAMRRMRSRYPLSAFGIAALRSGRGVGSGERHHVDVARLDGSTARRRTHRTPKRPIVVRDGWRRDAEGTQRCGLFAAPASRLGSGRTGRRAPWFTVRAAVI